MGMYCTLESGRRGVGWGLLSGQNKVSCCLDFVGPSLFKINPCCLELPKGWLISLFLVPRKSFLLRALFFPASIFTQKCGTDPVAHHHYPPMTPAERKPLLKRIRFLYYARTHFFVIVIYFYCNPPPFSPCPARKIVYKNKLFLFSTLILRPALKNNLKNCSQPRSFCKRRDMPLP